MEERNLAGVTFTTGDGRTIPVQEVINKEESKEVQETLREEKKVFLYHKPTLNFVAEFDRETQERVTAPGPVKQYTREEIAAMNAQMNRKIIRREDNFRKAVHRIILLRGAVPGIGYYLFSKEDPVSSNEVHEDLKEIIEERGHANPMVTVKNSLSTLSNRTAFSPFMEVLRTSKGFYYSVSKIGKSIRKQDALKLMKLLVYTNQSPKNVKKVATSAIELADILPEAAKVKVKFWANRIWAFDTEKEKVKEKPSAPPIEDNEEPSVSIVEEVQQLLERRIKEEEEQIKEAVVATISRYLGMEVDLIQVRFKFKFPPKFRVNVGEEEKE